MGNQNFKVCIRREDGYCSIRHSTTTSTSFSLSSQAAGTTAPTTGFRGSTDCYLDFITIPAARWMAPSLHLIASVEQSLVGLPPPPPINRSFLRWFPSRWVSALTTTTARTLPTELLLVTNSCLVEHPSCLVVPYREHIFGQNNPNS